MNRWIYDIESYPNFFSAVFKHVETGRRMIFEVSDRYDQAELFYDFMYKLAADNAQMVGYNNLGYDYPVIHHCLMEGVNFKALHAYQKTYQIIHGDRNDVSFIFPSDHIVQQIDLYKLHHFDNFARATSLKVLEFNMRSDNIGDLPVEPGKNVSEDMFDTLIEYNCHDVDETEKFYHYSKDKIEFRETLSVDINWNDTKIGKKHFQKELEKATPGICGTWDSPKQTVRNEIILKDVILPYIEFQTPALQNVLTYLKGCVLTETKAPPELKDLAATIGGFTIHFGAGGGHGSVERQHVRPEPGWSLLDVDVTSYYPSLAIQNRFYPAHLSEKFCDIYQELFRQRSHHPKKTAPNEMLKLALNGVYGDSANKYSPFFDQHFTMQITINGQLLLALLAEMMVTEQTNTKLIQFNTDGITFLMRTKEIDYFKEILCARWEKKTGLSLEHTEYSDMWIRDCNSYVARKTNGDVKRIGTYCYETARENPVTREVGWHKNHSALVVPKAAEAQMLHGCPVEEYIEAHVDPYDFMLRGKVPGGSRLRLGEDEPMQKVIRYYIAKEGKPLWKIMPPLAGKDKERTFAINKGWLVAICNDIRDFDPSNLNLDWYVQEARKIIIS